MNKESKVDLIFKNQSGNMNKTNVSPLVVTSYWILKKMLILRENGEKACVICLYYFLQLHVNLQLSQNKKIKGIMNRT